VQPFVFVDGDQQVLSGEPNSALRCVSSPAMIDKSCNFFPESAPRIAAVSRSCCVNVAQKMFSVPVESALTETCQRNNLVELEDV
jgi:hypothetical protein